MSERDPRTDLLFTYFTDTWADAAQRGFCFTLDRCVLLAAGDPRVRSVTVANPYRSWAVSSVRWLQGRRPPPPPQGQASSAVLRPMRLRRHDPTSPAAVARAYRRYDARLRRYLARSGVEEPVVVTANPFVAAWCPLEWAASVTYYGYDDWAALEANRRLWPAIRAAYREIGAGGRRVAAVSQPILDKIDPVGPRALIPNGVEPREWQRPWSSPGWVEEVESPLVLYLGVIEPRLDVEALMAVCEELPDATVALVGPVADASLASRLASIPNVQMREPVGRSEVPGLVHSADVCIMAHLDTPLTRAMSPLKIYEYLAAGRPVVATRLGPTSGIDDKVLLVDPGDSAGFAAAVHKALEVGPASEAEREEFVEDNSWRPRFERLWDLATAPG